jgi:hypothetical protein
LFEQETFYRQSKLIAHLTIKASLYLFKNGGNAGFDPGKPKSKKSSKSADISSMQGRGSTFSKNQ